MSAGLELDGLKELQASLRDVPSTLRTEILPPVANAAADDLVAELRGAYTKGGTGNLAAGVVKETMRQGIGVKVRNKAPHAHLYEYGTINRYTNKTGARRGVMPAQPTFVPAAIRARIRMVAAAKSALRAMKVPGFDGSLEVRES